MPNVTDAKIFGKYTKEALVDCAIQQVFLIYPAVFLVSCNFWATFKVSTVFLGCVIKKSIDYALPHSYEEKMGAAMVAGLVSSYSRKLIFGASWKLNANDLASGWRSMDYEKVNADKESFPAKYGAIYVETMHFTVLLALKTLGMNGDHLPESFYSAIMKGLIDGSLVGSVFSCVFKTIKSLRKDGFPDDQGQFDIISFEHSQRTITSVSDHHQTSCCIINNDMHYNETQDQSLATTMGWQNYGLLTDY